jgi:hypothetical protein
MVLSHINFSFTCFSWMKTLLPEIDMAYSFFTQLYGLNHLVTTLRREMRFFDDDPESRRQFESRNSIF